MIRISKPPVNIREKLAELERPIGLNGQALLATDTPQQAFDLLGARNRNRVINGDCRIDQRNAGASQNSLGGGSSIYLVDRWKYYASQSGKFNSQQNAGSITPPSGFSYYLGMTSASAYTSVTSDEFVLIQSIEGFNIADFNYGTSSSISSTLSFWVRSSLTGTHSGAIKNSAGDRSYPFSFTIFSANTWEQKQITISGDTSGTWLTTNGQGINVLFNLGSNSSTLGTAGTWTGNNRNGVIGSVSVVGTNGATFYITGVQLEPGTVATPFERRIYGQELALCQRYYEWVAFNLFGYQSTTGESIGGPANFAVTKRAAPTLGSVVADPSATPSTSNVVSTAVTSAGIYGCCQIATGSSSASATLFARGYYFSASCEL